MEKIKGQQKLRSVFIQYLVIEIIGALLLAVAIGASSLSILLRHVENQPKMIESEIEAWVSDSLKAEKFLLDKLPKDLKIYIYGEEELYSNLTSEEQLEFQKYLDSTTMIPNNSYIQIINGNKVYREYAMLGQRMMLKYQMEASYDTAGFEQKILTVGVIAFGMGEILWLIFVTGLYARKIKRELQKLTAASVEIGNQNLDFEIEHSRIKEIEDAIDAFEVMQNKTKEALKDMWCADKKRRDNNIDLAHRIKTSLTVIRGNTELMLETEVTDEQREYLETMRRQETEIINVVLDIVRDNENNLCSAQENCYNKNI